jgi:hypothetical protein
MNLNAELRMGVNNDNEGALAQAAKEDRRNSGQEIAWLRTTYSKDNNIPVVLSA